jgi:peroxiredoxin
MLNRSAPFNRTGFNRGSSSVTASFYSQKSLTYRVKTTPSAKTKSVQYEVQKPISGAKSLRYAIIVTKTAVTKTIVYRVKTSPSISKSMKYDVRSTHAAVTKSMKYTVPTAPAANTKSVKYTIPKTKAAITKTVTYEAIKNIAGTKSLRYAVLVTKAAVTKSLAYKVCKTQTAITKGLRYVVQSTHAAVTKSLKYTVPSTKAAITKGTVYVVFRNPVGAKQLKYVVKVTMPAITKSVAYEVLRPVAPTKSTRYTAKTSKNLNVYDASFYRNSPAFMNDGDSVGVNVPRYERINLLDNPSFENGASSWYSAVATHTEGGVNNGGYAEAQYSGWMYQVKTLMPVTSYLVKAWFRNKNTYSMVQAGNVQIPYPTVSDGEYAARICVMPAGSSEFDVPITISSYGCDISGTITNYQVSGYSGKTANSKGSVLCMLPKDGEWHELWFVVSYPQVMNCTINFLPAGGSNTIDVDQCMVIPATSYVPGFVDDSSSWIMNEEGTTNLNSSSTKLFTESLTFPIAPPVTPVNGGYWNDLSWSGDIMIPGSYSAGTKITFSGWYMPYSTDTSIAIANTAGAHTWSSNGFCGNLVTPTEWNKWYYFEHTYTVVVDNETSIRAEDRGWDYYNPANAGLTKGFWCNVQIEVKPYSSSFTDSARADEDISIPIGQVIKGSDWTIEGIFYLPYDATQMAQNTHPTVFQIGNYYSNSSVTLMFYGGELTPPSTTHYLQLWVKGQSNSSWSAPPEHMVIASPCVIRQSGSPYRAAKA